MLGLPWACGSEEIRHKDPRPLQSDGVFAGVIQAGPGVMGPNWKSLFLSDEQLAEHAELETGNSSRKQKTPGTLKEKDRGTRATTENGDLAEKNTKATQWINPLYFTLNFKHFINNA